MTELQTTNSGSRINEIKLCRASGWNNGLTGGEECWVVYLDGDEQHPLVSGSLQALLKWLGEAL